jgi:hypothetical protein
MTTARRSDPIARCGVPSWSPSHSAYGVVILAYFALGWLMHTTSIIENPGRCDPNNRLMGLLRAAFGGALSFAGIRRDK